MIVAGVMSGTSAVRDQCRADTNYGTRAGAPFGCRSGQVAPHTPAHAEYAFPAPVRARFWT